MTGLGHFAARAYLAAMRQPGRIRLLLVDGPAALGPERMAALDATAGGGTLREGLAQAFTAASLQAAPPLEATAALLSAAFDRAALAIDAGGDAAAYRAAIIALVDGLLRT